MRIQSYGALEATLLTHVCEIYVERRHPIEFRPSFRRMLCTNSANLLNSFNGRMVLGYRPPTRLPPFNPREKNLIITWDIIMIDYRCLNMDLCALVKKYPVDTKPNQDKFWKLFNSKFYPMPVEEKMMWMDS